jgi:hypothetical protein
MGQLAVLLAACLLGAVPAGAAERARTVPPFSVVTVDGRSVPSTALSGEGRWLLIYVAPGCPSCDRLVTALGEWRSLLLDARSVLVVGAAPAEASQYLTATRPPSLAGVAAYADETGQARRALQLGGAPAVIGIKEGRIEWTLDGVLNDPSAVESVVRTWVEH